MMTQFQLKLGGISFLLLPYAKVQLKAGHLIVLVVSCLFPEPLCLWELHLSSNSTIQFIQIFLFPVLDFSHEQIYIRFLLFTVPRFVSEFILVILYEFGIIFTLIFVQQNWLEMRLSGFIRKVWIFWNIKLLLRICDEFLDDRREFKAILGLELILTRYTMTFILYVPPTDSSPIWSVYSKISKHTDYVKFII